ncbi:hypothetical protein M9Y10_037549 [Tritrichomonas musculus]|uniref:Uncharacterized protein n=1 Tax=Tritrichomonas musculus TaxID=1915356 RepID=A0ABR2GTT7_9EUKA
MIGFFFTFSSCALQNCRLSAENVAGVQTMKDLFSVECCNISLTNITSVSSSEPFWTIDNFNMLNFETSASFINCDFSESSTFISFIGQSYFNSRIAITNTFIGSGFKGTSGASELILTEFE